MDGCLFNDTMGQQHASTSPTKEGRMSKRSRKRRDRKKKGANHGKKPNA